MVTTHSTEGSSSFEVQLQALASVVQQLKQGQLPLQQSLSLYEQGVGLVRQCQSELQATEGTFKLLQEALTQPAETATAAGAGGSTTEGASPPLASELGFRMHHRCVLPHPLTTEAPLKQLLLTLKTLAGGLNTHELPTFYKRANRTGFEAHLPLEVGYIHVSVIQEKGREEGASEASAWLLLDVAVFDESLDLQELEVLQHLNQWVAGLHS